MIQDIEPTDDINQKLKDEVKKILEDNEMQRDSMEYERYRDKAIRIASAAEESGFVRGFKYAFRLMMECIR